MINKYINLEVNKMRIYNEDIKIYLNNQIQKEINIDHTKWKFKSGGNYGVKLQELVGKYYEDNSEKFKISSVKINTDPSSPEPDVVISFLNGTTKGIEVKSCKNGTLHGVTICNSPKLINNKDALLINYNISNLTVNVQAVIETQIFRLITINKSGMYKGCLSSTRDTGKKIRGRTYQSFISTSDSDDYTLEQLTKPELIRKTILMYSASKLIDDEYNFADEEILSAIKILNENRKKRRKVHKK